MEDAARRHGGRHKLGPGGGGADPISALPEDLLLHVLVRLRCARAAARTSLLARRWRGLWTRLPDLVFRDVAADPLLPALTSLQAAADLGPGVSLLDIRVAEDDLGRGHSHRISSLGFVMKIYDIFKAYPFVECDVDLSSGSKLCPMRTKSTIFFQNFARWLQWKNRAAEVLFHRCQRSYRLAVVHARLN